MSLIPFSAPIGLSPTHIARLEKGVTVLSQENINKICEAFEVDKRYFECLIDVQDAVEKKNPEAGVANRLKLAREEKSWSQQELSRAFKTFRCSCFYYCELPKRVTLTQCNDKKT